MAAGVRRDVRRHLEPGAAVLVEEHGEVGRAGQRGIGAPLLGPKRRHGGTDLIEAGPTDRLGVDECTLGLVDVASQHVSGAGDVEEDSGERVPGQVVQLAGDASALLGHGLLGELVAGGLELRDELLLSAEALARART